MKRLFLASSGLSAIRKFVGGNPPSMNMLFIPTAGNLDENVWWIDKDREVLAAMGFKMTELDIENSCIDDQKIALDASDVVYVAGGNTFHLLNQFRKSGFDKQVIDFVDNGGMYAGASAGALIAGVDIKPIESIDEPDKVLDLESTTGLGLVRFVPVPHYNMNDRIEPIDKIKKQYSDKYQIVTLTDDQAVVIEGVEWKVVESKRNSLEMEWFRKSH